MLVLKNKKTALILGFVLFFVAITPFLAVSGASAQGLREIRCSDGSVKRIPASEQITAEEACADSGGAANTNNNQASGEPTYVPNDCNEGDLNGENCGIIRYLVIGINVLSVLAGIAIAASIAWGGIEYSMSGSDPQKVSAAKDRIRNAIIALVFFIFGYSLINYLIPGGLL